MKHVFKSLVNGILVYFLRFRKALHMCAIFGVVAIRSAYCFYMEEVPGSNLDIRKFHCLLSFFIYDFCEYFC